MPKQQPKGIEVKMLLEKETKGALRYAEVDEKGAVAEFGSAKIGTLYVRKSAFDGAEQPKAIVVSVKF